VWFLKNLRNIIGQPPGLAIHTDACKGLETVVGVVFPGVEHRECMRHLATNLQRNSGVKCMMRTYGQHHTLAT
jgi:hypothetical protein